MKKIILFMMVCFIISGCVTTKQVVKQRTDQAISGNRGVLKGNAEEILDSAERKTTRTITQIDVEFPSHSIKKVISKIKFWEKKQNKEGEYIKPQEERKVMPETVKRDRELLTEETTARAASKQVIDETVPQIKDKEVVEVIEEPIEHVNFYVVQKGETLGDIAQRPEVYGNASKWILIYNANKDKISNPDKIYQGTELVIPRNTD